MYHEWHSVWGNFKLVTNFENFCSERKVCSLRVNTVKPTNCTAANPGVLDQSSPLVGIGFGAAQLLSFKILSCNGWADSQFNQLCYDAALPI